MSLTSYQTAPPCEGRSWEVAPPLSKAFFREICGEFYECIRAARGSVCGTLPVGANIRTRCTGCSPIGGKFAKNALALARTPLCFPASLSASN